MERFAAADGRALENNLYLNANELGCLLSHLKAVQHAKANNWPNVLILEDDVELCNHFDEKFNATVSHLPNDWHALWLNGSDAKPLELYDAHLFKLLSCYSNFAYLVNHTFYDVLIEGYSKLNQSCDDFTSSIQQQYNCYRPVYPLAYHRNGYSVRLEKKVHYPQLTKPK